MSLTKPEKIASILDAPEASGWINRDGGGTVESGIVGVETGTGLPLAAVGDGVANDTSAVQAAISARKNVFAQSGKIYLASGLNLASGQSYDGRGSRMKAATGAYVFGISGFYAGLENIYVSDSLSITQSTIDVGDGRFQYVEDITIVNTGVSAIRLHATTGNGLANIKDITAEQVTGEGISIGSSVFEMRASAIYIAGLIDYSTGLGKPRAGSIGWRHNSPLVGDLARGGHQIDRTNMISSETGYWLTDVELTTFSQAIADAQTGYGLIIDGASDEILFDDFFTAFNRGIKVGGSSSNIRFNNLRTKNIGSIPSWGQASWYGGVSTFYAITVEGTAQVVIDGSTWRGDKRVSVAPTARLTVTGGDFYKGRNIANVAAGSTVYLTEAGAFSSLSDATWRVADTGYMFAIEYHVDNEPGTGNSYTITVQVDGVDTALQAVISDTGTFFKRAYGPIFVTEGQVISIKLSTSAGATAGTRHVVNVQQLPA